MAAKLAVLKELMTPIQAEYKTDIARRAGDNTKRDAEAAKRETRLIVTIAGLLAFAVAVFGLLIRLPA